jgi:hypothetical protein
MGHLHHRGLHSCFVGDMGRTLKVQTWGGSTWHYVIKFYENFLSEGITEGWHLEYKPVIPHEIRNVCWIGRSKYHVIRM